MTAASPKPEWLSLLGLARAEQAEARRRFARVWLAQGIGAVVGLPSLFVGGAIAFVLAAVLLVAQVGAWWFRRDAMSCHIRAEQGRRRSHLMFALDFAGERLDLAELRASFSKQACAKGAQFEDANYWATSEPPGPVRLAAAAQEGAFFSSQLYRIAAKRALELGGGALATIVVLLVLSLLVLDPGAELAAARAGVGLLSGLVAIDALGLGLDWNAASRQAATADRRLEDADKSRLDSLVAAYTDYSVVTASVPPIPDSVYAAGKNRLDALWDERSNAQ